MSNPTTLIESKPANTLKELLEEYERQYNLRSEKREEAKRLHLHNPFEINYYGLQGMAITLLQGEYGLTEKQSQLVEAECYSRYHSCFEDYLINLPSMAKFVKEIIES